MALSMKERARRWRERHPDRRMRDNLRRRKRRDNRDKQGIWGVKHRLMTLRCQRPDYDGIEVRITVIEIAKLWFRDKAWMLKIPHCDRIDPDGHYEFGNCRFIERVENLERRRFGSAVESTGREPGEDG